MAQVHVGAWHILDDAVCLGQGDRLWSLSFERWIFANNLRHSSVLISLELTIPDVIIADPICNCESQ